MNATDEKWDKLVESLHRAQPVLDEPEALTDRIMQQLDRPAALSTINLRNSYPERLETTLPRSVHSTIHLMNWIRLVSCSAAAFLLGLFVFQQRGIQGLTAGTSRWPAVENTLSVNSSEVRSFAGQSFAGRPAEVREAYFCYLKRHAIQNTKFRSYYQPSID
ncbi:MAG: hypothetical protein Q8914_05210 [Bacteroidota bacterium]|nr:hypothetical protein [Bacteroidota bacterium]